ncbi:hypothetical protein HY642_06955 [Candidatus Woesearchaeota archaeon]|nr:hypothetical protein [Candidatus Woesearchaeota archaeon]
METTTIQVTEDVVLLLKKLRDDEGASSYNEALRGVLIKETRPKESLWGYLGKKSMREILHGLRDKDD